MSDWVHLGSQDLSEPSRSQFMREWVNEFIFLFYMGKMAINGKKMSFVVSRLSLPIVSDCHC